MSSCLGKKDGGDVSIPSGCGGRPACLPGKAGTACRTVQPLSLEKAVATPASFTVGEGSCPATAGGAKGPSTASRWSPSRHPQRPHLACTDVVEESVSAGEEGKAWRSKPESPSRQATYFWHSNPGAGRERRLTDRADPRADRRLKKGTERCGHASGGRDPQLESPGRAAPDAAGPVLAPQRLAVPVVEKTHSPPIVPTGLGHRYVHRLRRR